MRRREFITLIGSGVAAWPLTGAAQQQPGMPVVGWLNSESPSGGYAPYAAAFRRGHSKSGFVEGRNVAIEYRWREGQHWRGVSDRL